MVATRAMSAAAGWPSRSRTTVARSVPIGMSVTARMQRMAEPRAVEEVLDRPDRPEQGAQPAVVEVTERSGPAVLGRDDPGEQIEPCGTSRGECIHRPSTSASSSGITFGRFADKFVDKPVVVTGVPARTFRLARRGRLNRQTGSRSDPRDGPGNQVRRSQGRRARNPATTRDCGLVRSLRTRRTEVPTSSFGRFRVSGTPARRLQAIAGRGAHRRPAASAHARGMWRFLLLQFLPRRLLPLLAPVRDRPARPPAAIARRPADRPVRRPDHRGPRDGGPAASHRPGRLTTPARRAARRRPAPIR